MSSQRDAYFNKLFKLAKEDKDIILISADMGAPSLDQWRLELSSQYINVGIAEANAIGIATGLAKVGKKVFVYAIAPFITLRCYEQIKLGPCAHRLPITLIGVGAGFSYEDSGPTHHTLEDVAIMSTLPHMTVVTITDHIMAEAFAKVNYWPTYIRLDRATWRPIYEPDADFSKGFAIVSVSDEGPVIITQGDLVNSFRDLSVYWYNEAYPSVGCVSSSCPTMQNTSFSLIDVFSIPCQKGRIIPEFNKESGQSLESKDIIVVEENAGSPLYNYISKLPLRSLTQKLLSRDVHLHEGYCYDYGGREQLRKHFLLDRESLRKLIR